MKTLSVLTAKTLLLTALLIATCSSALHAAPGDLDVTFNGVGYSDSALRGGGSYASGSALQSDGKIIMAGSMSGTFSAARYNTDGSIDESFGADGFVRVQFGENTVEEPGFISQTYARIVKVQPDGKIVVAGTINYRFSAFDSQRYDIVIVRLNPNGTLDTSFNANGKIRTRFSANSREPTALAIAADGKIIVAGDVGGNLGLLRFNPNGTPDTTFDGDGMLTIAETGYASDIVIQSDGKIITSGTQRGQTENSYAFATVRLNDDGTLDTTFNGSGVAATPPFVGWHNGHSVSLLPNGNIVVTGKWDTGQIAVLRYLPNGTFDNSFGSGGLTISYFSAYTPMESKALIQPDGKIVLATAVQINSSGPTNADFSVARLNQDGSVDSSFNGTGFRRISMGDGDEALSGLLLQPDGSILVTGHRHENKYEFAMARMLPDGGMDTSFGNDGKVISDVSYGGGRSNDVIVQSDGKLVVVGAGFSVVRYLADGTLDPAFNGTGRVTMFPGISSAASVVSQPDGKLLMVGRLNTAINEPADSVIVRLNGDGSSDGTFGSNGIVTTSNGAYNDEYNTVALQADGKILAGGSIVRSSTGSGSDLTLVRYTADGAFDTSFGRRGKVIGLAECGTSDSFISSVALQDDGKILAAGFCGGFAIMRFNSNGSLDNTFNNTGVKVISGVLFATHAADLKIQADGRIVVTGGYHDFVVARLDSNGDLDPSFNGNGIVTHSLGELPEGARSLEIQADGKLVVSGNYQAHALRYSGAVLRFNSDGSIDNTWGTAGVKKLPFTGNVFTSGTALDSDGKVLVSAQLNGLFGVVRLVGDSAAVSFASVSGQVRDLNGQPISRAIVLMTDSRGNTRSTQANPFGYYNFDDVRTGESYTLTAMAKRYRFSPRTVVVGGDLTGVDIISNQ